MTTTSTPSIGFVGLGHMGGNMAARFLAAGYPVYGEDQDRDRARGLMHDGLEWRRTPREVAEAADVVFTSVPDDNVLELVASGPGGILAGLSAGKIWVDMSTVSPNVSREIAKRVQALGAPMLDAPVSGSPSVAEAGGLFVMVGGDQSAYGRVSPVLDAMAKGHVLLGPSGAGAAMKLAVNSMIAVTNESIAETLILAERFGIARERAYDVLAGGVLASPFLLYKRGAFLQHLAAEDVGGH